MTRWLAAVPVALLLISGPAAHADEGMWPLHGFPFARVNSTLKTRIDQAWLDHVRASTVRVATCTGSFVSAEGLILTNNHCIETCLGEWSSKDKSYVEDGFLAKTRAEERRCQTQVADVLVDMEDITAKVLAAAAGKDEAAANDARKAELTRIEQACETATKLKCQAFSLYAGGQYWLYRYRRYTDLRLVFTPEVGIAQFGGDPDNFQFPRWNLDMAVLRAWENDAPVTSPDYLKLDFAGPAAGEPVFVAGHPGNTARQLTLAQLKQHRNLEVTQWLLRYSEIRGRFIQFAEQSEENRRVIADQLIQTENAIKVRRKFLDALHDDSLLARKAAEENQLRTSVAKNAKLKAGIGDPWKDIETALATERRLFEEYTYLENNGGFQGRLITFARNLVRGADEREKPNAARFREFTDAALPRMEQQLVAEVPVHAELEIMRLGNSLERMREWLGPDHPVVRRLMAKESPAAVARRVVTGSRLGDPAVRRELWKGGKAALAASQDPMIEMWRSVDPDARAIRKAYEDGVEGPVRSATERIARARFAVLGTEVYPDATFTLRLNWGTVQGWNENGTDIAPFTYLGRAFERATGAAPFRIPDSWMRARDKLDLKTPFDYASNNDCVGGNSGSPVINAKGELVGLSFDVNMHQISGNYWFDISRNRAIAVHPAIMREALSKVYGADALLAELTK